ncbi:hypothetical protein ADK87_12360 [Streptomyces sp. NRRL F-4711]|nr:hypothetical protein ADK87_12360 [Streptomyces sp. NRRL F-4711]
MRPGRAGEPAGGIGHDLHVHTVTAVLLGEVGPGVADMVALDERPVEQNVIRIGLTKNTQEVGCPARQVIDDGRDVSMGGVDGYTEAGAICASVSCRRR